MSRSLRRSLAAVAIGLFAVTASFANTTDSTERTRRAATEERDALRTQLAQTQRVIRTALVEAALTTEQLSQAYAVHDNFVDNYARALQANDPTISEMTFDEVYDAKVGRVLQQRFALTAGEVSFLRTQVRAWVDLELNELGARDLEGGE